MSGGSLRGQIRVSTIVTMRWVILAGQFLVLTLAVFGFRFDAPTAPCFALILVGVLANALTVLSSPRSRIAGSWESVGHLTFDLLQIASLLYLTGGVENPFFILVIAPVTMAAASLPVLQLGLLATLAVAITFLLAMVHLPLPSAPDFSLTLPPSYILGATLANLSGLIIISGYVRHAATDSARMGLALDVTQAVLAREQRLSALGALAAAAAHELGTPLATIAIVAKEMAREATTPTVKEDAELLVAQAARCREILRRLTDAPDAASDEVHERMTLLQLLNEVLEPHATVKGVRIEAIVTGAPNVAAPDIGRRPEVLHALTSFVENAVDFAESEVLVSARFDADSITVEVRDDGPGFAPDILAKLGEPYVTSRAGVAGGRTGHVGMGLGFFIAKTLLERTQARVTFTNSRPRGAVVSARWAREMIEASAFDFQLELAQ